MAYYGEDEDDNTANEDKILKVLDQWTQEGGVLGPIEYSSQKVEKTCGFANINLKSSFNKL